MGYDRYWKVEWWLTVLHYRKCKKLQCEATNGSSHHWSTATTVGTPAVTHLGGQDHRIVLHPLAHAGHEQPSGGGRNVHLVGRIHLQKPLKKSLRVPFDQPVGGYRGADNVVFGLGLELSDGLEEVEVFEEQALGSDVTEQLETLGLVEYLG